MSPTGTPKHFTLSHVVIRDRAIASDGGHAPSGRWSWSWSVLPEAGCDSVGRWCPPPLLGRGRVPASGCIVGTPAAELSSPALRVAARVLSDQGLTAPQRAPVAALSVTRSAPSKRGKEDTMNRWTG